LQELAQQWGRSVASLRDAAHKLRRACGNSRHRAPSPPVMMHIGPWHTDRHGCRWREVWRIA
jgi:hypothetical protein